MHAYLQTPPFDALSFDERNRLAKHSQIVYLDENSPMPTAWHGDFFVILKGKIKETLGDELIAGLGSGDWFDSNQNAAFTPSEQTLMLRLDGETLKTITKSNRILKNLLFASLTDRIEQNKLRQAGRQSQNLLHKPISELHQHIKSPNFITASASLFEAVVAMNGVSAKHILIKDGERIGMFTQADACRAIADKADFETTCVEKYSNFELTYITPTHEVSDALLTMLNHKIHRLPIMDDGQIVGVLGQSELLSFLAHHSQLIVARIEQASCLDELKVATEAIGRFIRTQYDSGTKTYIIARMVQGLNLQVFAKLWQLIAPSEVVENTCVMVMGSEGRGEQIMRTDQDNALIVRDGFDCQDLGQYTQRFNEALNTLGYPYCTGGIMMNNARWCLTLGEFKKQLSTWFGSGSFEDMMWLAVVMDSEYVCGDRALFDKLREHLHYAYHHQATSNFINRFAKPMVQFGDGHNFWQKFTGGHDSDIDLKKAGIFPIVHGVRTLALDHDIDDNSTKARLNALANQGVIEANTAQNLMEAMAFFLSKRLEVSLSQSDKSAWKVNPNTLSALDKDLLKQSLAIVKEFKSMMERCYRLDVF